MRPILILFTIILNQHIFAQDSKGQDTKNLIDTGMLGKWSNILRCFLSPNGQYLAYGIDQHLPDSRTLIIQDTAGAWQRTYTGIGYCEFLGDDRRAVLQSGDSMHIVNLGGNKKDSVIAVHSFRHSSSKTGEWIAYQEKGGQEEVVLANVLNGVEHRLGRAEAYEFGRQGKCLLITRRMEGDSGFLEQLDWIDLSTGKESIIWTGGAGEQHGNIEYDYTDERISFPVTGRNGIVSALWYYRVGSKQSVARVKLGDPGLPAGALINERTIFGHNGRWLFFSLRLGKAVPLPSDSPKTVKVDIWSYKDRVVQPDQLIQEKKTSPIMAVIGTDSGGLRILTHGDEKLETPGNTVMGDEVVISCADTTKWNDLGGSFAFRRSYYTVSLTDGRRRYFKKDASAGLDYFRFSPGDIWLIYFDEKDGQYYSYNMNSEVLLCITLRLPKRVSNSDLASSNFIAVAAPAGWWSNEGRVLIYDLYDLWGVDPSNLRPALNITIRYGASRHVELRLTGGETGLDHEVSYSSGDTLTFIGFGERTKYNGFLRQILGSPAMPTVLTMGPYLYYHAGSQKPNGNSFSQGMLPLKASFANCWIVERQTASEAPNYFFTTDWVHFKGLSRLSPQSNYNWIKAELVQWHQLDGTLDQGVLYKPENFDPVKKYPVIINYYEQLSHRLYEFPLPGLTEDDINIPWFVSRGYLVFTPDIHYRLGVESGKTVGWWAYNAIESGAKYLSTLPYVDGRRMGLQGHSFGGFETNYLVTHSHLFAAAAEFSGPTDMVSMYLSLTPGMEGLEDHADLLQRFMEIGQYRIAATLWQRPELYLGQSPVLQANNVTTPLLMVHNKKDGAVPWRQGIEFYLALRRLGKKVWMLQYDDGYHSNLGNEALDYTLRLTQFFDYYLKHAEPPNWMTQGIPNRLKGIEMGFGPDLSGQIP